MDEISSINSISNIRPVNLYDLKKILASQKLTDKQKAEYINKNRIKIKNLMKDKITKQEFAYMMQNRPLIRFRPLKNSYTKKGDKILLAKSVGINPNEVNAYVQRIAEATKMTNNYTTSDIDKVKTYVYRHGTKEQVVTFLEHELSDVGNILTNLYKTLEDNSGGLADYFSRPIHRMDNITLSKLYNAIDKGLNTAVQKGVISKADMNSTSEWALVRIYEIQNNSKLIRAVNVYKNLT